MFLSAKDSVSRPWFFIALLSGLLVALGQAWQVPLLASAHGGAVFVLLYVSFLGLIGLPVLMAELMLGRRGRGSPPSGMRTLALEGRFAPAWKYAGGLAMLNGFLMLSHFSVTSSWSLAYGLRLLTGEFVAASPEQFAQSFESFLASPLLLIGLLGLFLAVTVAVVSQGLAGVELAIRLMVPLLLLALLALLVFAVNLGDVKRSTAALLSVDLAQLRVESVWLALRLAFYSVALGLGALMMFGASLPKKISIGASASAIVVLSTLVSLVLGWVFLAFVSEPSSQAGLESHAMLFVNLPSALAQLPGGGLIGALFFVVLAVTGWLASFALFEPALAWVLEKGWTDRLKAALVLGLLLWLLALPSVFSFNVWRDVSLLGKTFFELLAFFVAILQPVTALLLVIFAAWIMKRTVVEKELNLSAYPVYAAWTIVLRLLCPLAMVFVLGAVAQSWLS